MAVFVVVPQKSRVLLGPTPVAPGGSCLDHGCCVCAFTRSYGGDGRLITDQSTRQTQIRQLFCCENILPVGGAIGGLGNSCGVTRPAGRKSWMIVYPPGAELPLGAIVRGFHSTLAFCGCFVAWEMMQQTLRASDQEAPGRLRCEPLRRPSNRVTTACSQQTPAVA